MKHDILQDIIADKKTHLAACKSAKPFSAVAAEAAAALPPRDFYGALLTKHRAGQTALITEIKKASPSAGLIRAEYDPAAIARNYEQAGAACLSVLTDAPYFQGSDADLVAARHACTLPVLRKDFMIDPYQIAESRALGADCVLLIMACLSDAQMQELMDEAARWNLTILIEIHDEVELERFLKMTPSTVIPAKLCLSRDPITFTEEQWDPGSHGSFHSPSVRDDKSFLAMDSKYPKTMLGINNRNLKTLAVDLATTKRLAELLRAINPAHDYLLVGESGIKTRVDIDQLKLSGVHCFLVGEHLLKQANIGAAVKTLL